MQAGNCEQRVIKLERDVTGPPSAFGSNVSQASERNLPGPLVFEGGGPTELSSPESTSHDPHVVAEALVRAAEGVDAIEPLQSGTNINRQRAAEADLRNSFGLETGEVRTKHTWTRYRLERSVPFTSSITGDVTCNSSHLPCYWCAKLYLVRSDATPLVLALSGAMAVGVPF